jgi:HSP20 family protein
MYLMHTPPWQLLNRLQGNLDRLSDLTAQRAAEAGGFTPAVDIHEEENHYLLRADLPGVEPKDIEINVEDGVLTIRGERKTEARTESGGYSRTERTQGAFLRRFTLPDSVDDAQVSARSQLGVLEVVIPKQPKVVARKIPVLS